MAERRTANAPPRKPEAEPEETAKAKPHRPKLREFQATWIHDGIEEPVDLEISGRPARPAAIQPEAETSETSGTQRRAAMLEDGKSFIQNGVRYFPLSSVAPVVQAPPSTILHWIKKETNFGGKPLDSYYFAPANRYFLSEESIERAANRFINWRSQHPAGPVTIGHTRNQSGYVRLQEAAQTLGVDHHTMWRWATKGTAPTDKPLDVIKDPATDQFYIREAEVSKLKKVVPRSGLRAGRRQSPTPRPS